MALMLAYVLSRLQPDTKNSPRRDLRYRIGNSSAHTSVFAGGLRKAASKMLLQAVEHISERYGVIHSHARQEEVAAAAILAHRIAFDHLRGPRCLRSAVSTVECLELPVSATATCAA